jgi:hypothetical protein
MDVKTAEVLKGVFATNIIVVGADMAIRWVAVQNKKEMSGVPR